MIALLVLLPETLAAVRNARRDRVQISFNLAYGSAMASIGLTIPAIAVASIWLDGPAASSASARRRSVLLALTVVVGALTCCRAGPPCRQGGVHLVAVRRLPLPRLQSLRRAGGARGVASAFGGLLADVGVDDEDAAAAVLGDGGGDAAEHHPRHAGAAVGADHDHPGVERGGNLDDLLPGVGPTSTRGSALNPACAGELRSLFGDRQRLLAGALLQGREGGRVERRARGADEGDLLERLGAP